MKNTIFTIAAIILFASAAFAQGSIEGTVTDAKGKSVANVTVTIVGAGGKAIATAKSDGNGAYAVEGIAAGKYKVVATGTSGYKPAILDDVVVEDEAATTLDITLVAAVQAPVPKPTVTPVAPKAVVQTPPPGINVRVGQKFSSVSEINLTSVSNVMGQALENSTTSTSTVMYEVVAVEADSIKLTVTVSLLRVQAWAMGQEISFDSTRNDNSGQMADELSKVVGKTRTMTISRTGRTIKVDGLGESSELNIVGIEATGISGNELFEPELTLPELKPGMVIPSSSTGAETTQGSFLVNSVLRGTAGLTYTGKGQLTGKIEQMGQEMETKMTWTENAALQVDVTTRVVLSRDSTREQKSTITTAGMGIPAEGKLTVKRKVTPLN